MFMLFMLLIIPDAIKSHFENQKISLDGVLCNHIFNYDETNLTDNPDSKTVITSVITCSYYLSRHKTLFKHTKDVHVKSGTSYVQLV